MTFLGKYSLKRALMSIFSFLAARRIMVLDKGVVKEFDSPQALLANKESLFYGLAKDANIVE